MLGINGPEFLVLGVLALLVIGPERLPGYAAQLGRLVRELRRMASGARDQLRTEMGPEFEDIDWQKLDPRQYDPRRIVRDALRDEVVSPSGPSAGAAAGAAAAAAAGFAAGGAGAGSDGGVRPVPGAAPFDTEAT